MPLLIQEKKLDTADRIQLGISYALQLALLIAAIISFVLGNWLNAFLTIGILFLTFLPKLIRRNYKVFLPVEFDLLIILFIFASFFLGELHGYYTSLWWWDIALHTSSGFLVGIAGFLLVYILNEEKKAHLQLKPGFLAFFAFNFAVFIGVLWEIIEFILDQSLGLQTQHNSVIDTMWDLIVDSLGALVIAVLGYFYIRSTKSLIFNRMIRRFLKNNPQLFRKKKES